MPGEGGHVDNEGTGVSNSTCSIRAGPVTSGPVFLAVGCFFQSDAGQT